MSTFPRCESCLISNDSLLYCNCLSKPAYCNTLCQKKHWPLHKTLCLAEKAQWKDYTLNRSSSTLQECLTKATIRYNFKELWNIYGSSLPTIYQLVDKQSRGKLRLDYKEGRGRSLIANRNITKYETILFAEAEAWLPANLGDELAGSLIPGLVEFLPLCGGNESKEMTFYKTILSLLRLEPICIDTKNETLVDSDINFPTLCELLVSISTKNVLSVIFDESLQSDEKNLLIFNISMLMANHSCCPNSTWIGYFSGRAPSVKMIAERNIEEGEEVLISYIPRSYSLTRRRTTLQEKHGFICNCKRCLEEESNPEVALAAEKSQEELDKALSKCGANLWDESPNRRCEIVENSLLLSSIEVRGRLAMWDLILLCGHVQLLAGKRDLAIKSYEDATIYIDILKSPSSLLSILIRDFVKARKEDKDKSMKHMQSEIIKFEQTRSTRVYTQWEKLPDEFRTRFLQPIRTDGQDQNEISKTVNKLVEIGRESRKRFALI
jgi:hypothetical protein